MANRAKTQKGKVGEASEKRLEAFRLFKMGWVYRDIAGQLGISFQRVGQYIKEELDRLKAERAKLGNDIIEAELEKLAMMERELMPLTKEREVIMNGAPVLVGPDKEAVHALLRIQERRTKYLGLDAPKKLEHDVGETLENLIAGSRPKEEPK